MAIPWLLSLKAWLPFPVIALIGIVLAGFYYFHFQKKCQFFKMISCNISVVFSIFVVILVPVDVFLVSCIKTQNYTKFSWVNNATLNNIENTVLYAYYVIYGVVLLMIFVVLPFCYFFDDDNENEETSNKSCTTTFKWTFISFIMLIILFTVGVIAPAGNSPSSNSSFYQQMNFFHQYNFIEKGLEKGLIFVINCLSLIGMICSIIYTAYGMSILPINLLKGPPSPDRQILDMEISINELMEKIQVLSNKKANEPPLSAVERQRLIRYSWQLSELQSSNDTLRLQNYSSVRCCTHVVRFVKVVIGVILIFFSLFIVSCLIISNVNRLISSFGIYTGYLLNQTTIINPIDEVLLLCHPIFPLDYLLLSFILLYFALSSIAGMQHMGIWILWIQLHRLRRKNTPSRALLISAALLVCVVLYAVVLVYSLAPQYVTYGTQAFKAKATSVVSRCSFSSPADECIMTRLMTLQTRLFYRMWFIGVAYFWCSWIFILTFCISCAFSIFRSRKTVARLITRTHQKTNESRENLISD